MIQLILRWGRRGVKVAGFPPRLRERKSEPLGLGGVFLCLFFVTFTLLIGSCTREKVVVISDPVWWELYGREENGVSTLMDAAKRLDLRVESILGEFKEGKLFFPDKLDINRHCPLITPLAGKILLEKRTMEGNTPLGGVLLNWYGPVPEGWRVVHFEYQEAYYEAGELVARELFKDTRETGGIGLVAALFLLPSSTSPWATALEARISAFKEGMESEKGLSSDLEGPILQLETLGPETEQQQYLKALEELLKYEPDALLLVGFDYTRVALESLQGKEDIKKMIIIVEEGLKIPNFIELIDYSIETDIYILLEEALKVCADGGEGPIISVPATLEKYENP